MLISWVSLTFVDGKGVTHLTSAKVLGRSTIRAPPNSGVLV